MKKRLRFIIPLLLVLLVAVFIYNNLQKTENDADLRFSGNIEVTEARMSFKIPGRLESRPVEEGDAVAAGQTLARLEQTDQVIAVSQAEANLAYATAVLAELQAGSRPEEIEQASARVAQARQTLTELQNGSRTEEIENVRAEYERTVAAEQASVVSMRQAQNDFERYQKLHQEGSVSTAVYEDFQTRYDTTQKQNEAAKALTKSAAERLRLFEAGPRIEQIRRAEAALQQAQAEYALIKAGPRRETIEQAAAKKEAAAATLDAAKQQLVYTQLTAPMDGIVLTTSAEPGEYLNPASPVLTLGQLSRPWLRAYINEKDLGRIKLGQEVAVSTDSYPGKTYTGQVSFISAQAEFTPKTVQTFEERVKLMYRIKVDLDNPDLELKPGMPADGIITFKK